MAIIDEKFHVINHVIIGYFHEIHVVVTKICVEVESEFSNRGWIGVPEMFNVAEMKGLLQIQGSAGASGPGHQTLPGVLWSYLRVRVPALQPLRFGSSSIRKAHLGMILKHLQYVLTRNAFCDALHFPNTGICDFSSPVPPPCKTSSCNDQSVVPWILSIDTWMYPLEPRLKTGNTMP